MVAAVVLGALLRGPALDAGFRDDDYVQRAMLEGAFPLERASWDLFWFSGRSLDENRILRDAGYVPWWTSHELRLGMLRPLSSALVAFDHAAFGTNAAWHHVHSFAWWALVLVAAALVLARLLPPAAAALAVLLLGLDESFDLPIAWLANRSTLVSTAFALLALWAHLRWREDGWRPGVALAFVGAGLALAGGEYALCTLVYVVAYEAWAGRGGPVRRALSLLPTAVPVGAYAALRALLGHDVRASGYYVSPLEAERFATTALPRVPALAGDAVLGLPAAWWNGGSPWRGWLLSLDLFDPQTWRALPDWQSWHVGLGLVAIASLVGLVRWAHTRAVGGAPALGWLALGAALSLVPAAGSLPSNRVLAGAGFGVLAIVASTLVEAWRARRGTERGRGTALALLLGLGSVHVALAAERAWSHARDFRARTHALLRYALEAEIPTENVANLDVVVLQGTDFTTAAHVPWVRWAHGLGLPRSYRRLSGAMRAHDLLRVGPDALELEVLSDDVGDAAAGSLYRPRSSPVNAGAKFELRGLTVDVLDSRDGNPARIRFQFDDSLDASGSTLVLVARPEGLVRLELPPPGKEVRLPLAWGGGAP